MNKLAKLVFAAASAAIALSATAQEIKDIKVRPNSLYLQDSRDVVTRSGFGLCWQTAFVNGPCEEAPAQAAAPAAAPAAPAAAAAAAPTSEKVTYAADAFFDFDKAVLKPAGKSKLDELVANLNGLNLEVIIAVGHTDSVGSVAYNQKLSVRRAESVKAYLVSKGVEANRVYTEGKGKSQPVADNKSAAGRAKNRRVEIEVVGTRNK
ncbi:MULTISPECIES: outer membrane protein OmpA [unclassified Herbaspirillum]|jgi:OOP family OmpA-OmpF porin|uniref:outer membrane protein OmpA n=1 Tax=unclassified Herbaspirillum TaxID=2624150 RepID=UPI000E2FE7F2|nr:MULTISPECIES: OmpA family protein [unclassified Herbaspirillum]RFB74154.1 OmpA family protein [Herbaspirillum sp. 3R-3a1]TFI10027.1 OmpA family protein [Herbaspirillum sp. 3R11]TFI15931.1 OmpA family protein [Herbaspirillum sp. 3R-11]TFI23014.1 OmpA family protein [Herbaspirillum sp. 3C11]